MPVLPVAAGLRPAVEPGRPARRTLARVIGIIGQPESRWHFDDLSGRQDAALYVRRDARRYQPGHTALRHQPGLVKRIGLAREGGLKF